MRHMFLIFVMTAAVFGSRLSAQDFRLSHTTELQTAFRGSCNWVNMLRTDCSLPLGRHLNASLASVSIARTSSERLLSDRQVFSNIDEASLPFAPAVLGLEWKDRRVALFLGIRNVNEDYFTSPCASLFTNSSCGIFPTISSNYPIANYPVAAVGADVKIDLGQWSVEVSVYNGTGHNRLTGRENVFRICPAHDGVFGMMAAGYENDGSCCYAGMAVYHGVLTADSVETDRTAMSSAQGLYATLWGYAELRVGRHTHVLAQCSGSTVTDGCRMYAGGGVVMERDRVCGGLFAGYAGYGNESELACEATCRIDCAKNVYVQPAVHFVRNSHECGVAAMLRLGFSCDWHL